jgi:hypothetical protein
MKDFTWLDSWDNRVNEAIPDTTHSALVRYFLHGLEPGSFLTSVLCNMDLYTAVGKADVWNQRALSQIVVWLHTYAPDGSYGSQEAYEGWLNNNNIRDNFNKEYLLWTLKQNHSEKTYEF